MAPVPTKRLEYYVWSIEVEAYNWLITSRFSREKVENYYHFSRFLNIDGFGLANKLDHENIQR